MQHASHVPQALCLRGLALHRAPAARPATMQQTMGSSMVSLRRPPTAARYVEVNIVQCPLQFASLPTHSLHVSVRSRIPPASCRFCLLCSVRCRNELQRNPWGSSMHELPSRDCLVDWISYLYPVFSRRIPALEKLRHVHGMHRWQVSGRHRRHDLQGVPIGSRAA